MKGIFNGIWMGLILWAIILMLAGCSYTAFNDNNIIWERQLVPMGYWDEKVNLDRMCLVTA